VFQFELKFEGKPNFNSILELRLPNGAALAKRKGAPYHLNIGKNKGCPNCDWLRIVKAERNHQPTPNTISETTSLLTDTMAKTPL
jgi:hypothetical protein